MTAGEDCKPGKAAPAAGGGGVQGWLQELWQEFTGGTARGLCWLVLAGGLSPACMAAALPKIGSNLLKRLLVPIPL